MSNRAVFSFSLSSAGSLLAAGFILVSGLTGCGFKSDLTVSDSQSESQLFVPDNPPNLDTDDRPPPLPSSSESTDASEGIAVDIATEVATEGQILVPASAASAASEESADGVVVDLTGVAVDISESEITEQ